jgi:hypothetical protein
MRIILCDGCKKDLTETSFARVQVRGKALDLCQMREKPNDGGCLKHFTEYERQVESLADRADKDLDANHATIEAKFWEGVRRGS